MRKVVDSNYLRSPDLNAYLAASPSNEIVLTEFILMEQYRSSNAKLTVRESMAICARFTRQVIVLKRSANIMRVALRSSGLANRLVDKREGEAVTKWCQWLYDPSKTAMVDERIAFRGAESAAHMNQLRADCEHMTEIFDRISSQFTRGELMEIRARRPLRRTTQIKLMDAFFDESRRLYLAAEIEAAYWPKTNQDAVNSFPFRYALCIVLLYMRWLKDGEPKRTAERFRNDAVDANTAAFGTYFGGVLSADKKLKSVHREARHIVGQFGGYIGV